MVHRKIYQKAYPLHDGPADKTKADTGSLRAFLIKNWASRWFAPQPLDAIRNYFGEKIAFYYAWLGFYTKMLLFAGIMGAGAFAYGLYKAFTYF